MEFLCSLVAGVQLSIPDFYHKMKDRLRTSEQGADTIVWLAVASCVKEFPSGLFFQGVQLLCLQHMLTSVYADMFTHILYFLCALCRAFFHCYLLISENKSKLYFTLYL